MKLSEHAKLRYVQRVIGIEDINEAKQYLNNNEYFISYKLLEFYNSSKPLYKNYAPTRKETLDYFIKDDYLIVVNKKTEIVTLYNMTLETEDDINQKLIKSYVKTIKNNNYRINQIEIVKRKQDQESKHLEYLIDRLKNEIDIYKYELEFEISKEKCIKYAAEQKELRMENRKLMTELFIKR